MEVRPGDQPQEPQAVGFPVLRFFGGHQAGMTYALEFPLVTVGRDIDNDLVLEDNGVSRKHCRFVLRAGQVHLLDCHSTNGTYVGGERVESAVLRDGDEILLGTRVRLRYVVLDGEERELERKLVESANHDSVTKVLLRRPWLEKTAAQFKQFLRKNRPVSLALCEVDQFAVVSEQLGPAAGRALLMEFCRRCRSLGREALLGRTGEWEFGLLLAGFPATRAQSRMDRLCQDVARHPFEVAHEQRVATTVSIGVATATRPCDLEELLNLSEKALAAARRGGRNRVCAEIIDLPAPASSLYSTGLLVLEQKRRKIRKSCLREIWVLSEMGDFGGKLLDIGGGGVRVQLDQPVKVGQPLEIALSEQKSRTLSAVVKWQRGGQYGLRFLDQEQFLQTTWLGGLLGVGWVEEERRQTARVPMRTPMTLKTANLTYACDVITLSYGGLSAQTPLVPAIGVEATVEIGRFEAPVFVVWSGNGQFGLKFLQLSNRQQQQLRELVKVASVLDSP